MSDWKFALEVAAFIVLIEFVIDFVRAFCGKGPWFGRKRQ